MSQEIISDAERQAQTLISESAGDQDLIKAQEAEPVNLPEQGEVDMPDMEDTVDVEDDEEVFVPRTFSDILGQVVGESNVVRLILRPELDFVINLFNDDVHNVLVEMSNFEFNDQKLNVIQPLSKLNDRTGRVGVLRQPLRDFVDTIQGMMANEERVVVTPDTGSLVLDSLVQEFLSAAENTLYSNFPNVDGIPSLQLEDTLVDARDYIRLRTLATVKEYSAGNGDSTPTVEATVKFIVHLRLPLLIREESNTFEKTMKLHFKYLENCGIKAGLPTSIYAGFYTQDLVNESVMNCFNWIRENAADMEILSYRNLENGGDFFGIQGFEQGDYEDALFNGGDFLVALNLEKEGE